MIASRQREDVVEADRWLDVMDYSANGLRVQVSAVMLWLRSTAPLKLSQMMLPDGVLLNPKNLEHQHQTIEQGMIRLRKTSQSTTPRRSLPTGIWLGLTGCCSNSCSRKLLE
ncbi:MAG TPA: hypothetical protein PKA76_01245 [Pirellulaceae bacterium]|nr:hypothetical protein [Pirellulaceae bacterium]HMP67947.1 hypothetical protein [Pirellulaceae bacterium]